jgi:hypothetical protein
MIVSWNSWFWTLFNISLVTGFLTIPLILTILEYLLFLGCTYRLASCLEMSLKLSSFIDSVQDVLIASGYFSNISSRTAITKQGQGVGQSPFF